MAMARIRQDITRKEQQVERMLTRDLAGTVDCINQGGEGNGQ